MLQGNISVRETSRNTRIPTATIKRYGKILPNWKQKYRNTEVINILLIPTANFLSRATSFNKINVHFLNSWQQLKGGSNLNDKISILMRLVYLQCVRQEKSWLNQVKRNWSGYQCCTRSNCHFCVYRGSHWEIGTTFLYFTRKKFQRLFLQEAEVINDSGWTNSKI